MKNKEQLELYKNLNEQNSLRDIQKYINKVNEIRGFNKQEVTKTMLFYVLNCVCNKLNIDIFDCIKEKEGKNIDRVWN